MRARRWRTTAPWTASVLATLALLASGCFPHQAGPRLAHFETTAPAIGTAAPLFALSDLDGNAVELATLIGTKPIVLQFGSHSCPVYRYRRFSLAPLWSAYRDRVHFLMVYTVEAHPVGDESPYTEAEWDLWINRLVGVRVPQATSLAARREQAATSQERLELEPLMMVDNMDNAVWRTWGAASSSAFVIDRGGDIVARQVWVRPKEIRRVLDRLLDQHARDGS